MTGMLRKRSKTAGRQGARDMAPLAAALAPIAFVIGATAARSLNPFLAVAMGPVIFGASGQLVVIRMLGSHAAPLLILATVAIVNARLTLYGAVMAPHWRCGSLRWKLLASAFLVEPTVALGEAHAGRTTDDAAHRRYYMSAALCLWLVWLAATVAGVCLGTRASAVVPEAPVRVLAFVALAVPAARASAGTRRAAFVGATAALALSGTPYGLGVLAAAALGIAGGIASERGS